MTPLGFPLPSGKNPQSLSWKEYFLYGGAGIALIGLLVLLALEISFLQNAFDPGVMLLVAAGIGAAAGGFLAWRLQTSAHQALEKIQLFVLLVFLGALLFLLFASLSNRLLSTQPPVLQPFVFVEEKPFGSSRFGWIEEEPVKPDGYYLYFFSEHQIKRMKTTYPVAAGLTRGDTLWLPIRQGLWGVKWVAFPAQPSKPK